MTAAAQHHNITQQKISFVVKTYNEERKIAACIESILAAVKHIANPFEIIVADSVSADNTVAVASQFPVKIVQFSNPQERGCGAGVQLGYQHSEGDLVFLLDGDMRLQAEFLPAALDALNSAPKLAGVAGLMQEVAIRNTFDALRVQSGATSTAREEKWLNGGGLYRRAAIEEAGGYAANRNLKGWEEAELGMRLRSAGWSLQRINVAATLHDGHASSTWPLMWRHWKSRRLMSNGVLLRSALGQPWQMDVARMQAHPILVLLFWLANAVALIALPSSALLRGALWLPLAAVFIALCIKKRSVKQAIQSILLWHVNAMSLVYGLFLRTTPPTLKIASREIPRARSELKL